MAMIKIIKDARFDEIHARHLELMSGTDDHSIAYQRIVKDLYFPKGKKVTIDVEITDDNLSGNLFNLLHGKVEGEELLGFKVTRIWMDNQAPVNHIVRTLDEAVQGLEQLKKTVRGL